MTVEFFVLLALYIVPILRVLTLPFLLKNDVFIELSRQLGNWELIVGFSRDFILLPILLILQMVQVFDWSHSALELSVVFGALCFTVLNRQLRTKARLRFVEWFYDLQIIHPQEFFDLLTASSGPFNFPLKRRRDFDPLAIDFRQTKGRDRIRTGWGNGIISTIRMSRLCMLANRAKGSDFLCKLAAPTGLLWATRLMQVVQAKVEVKNGERCKDLSPYTIYCLNHESLFDFVVAPLLLVARMQPGDKQLSPLPCFFMAKDHFIDSFFVNRILGLGQLCKALGMIFVERKITNLETARNSIKDGVHNLVERKLPVAIFPQGTRSKSTVDINGKLEGAAYYALGKLDRLTKEGGHLKKGAAYLAIDAAIALMRKDVHEPVMIMPVGLKGPAVVCPRKQIALQKGKTITLHVGESIDLHPDTVRALAGQESFNSGKPPQEYHDVVSLTHRRINESLLSLLKVHESLAAKFYRDVQKVCDSAKIDRVTEAFKLWNKSDPLIYVILDYIYAGKPDDWCGGVSGLSNLLLEAKPREDFVKYRDHLASNLV